MPTAARAMVISSVALFLFARFFHSNRTPGDFLATLAIGTLFYAALVVAPLSGLFSRRPNRAAAILLAITAFDFLLVILGAYMPTAVLPMLAVAVGVGMCGLFVAIFAGARSSNGGGPIVVLAAVLTMFMIGAFVLLALKW